MSTINEGAICANIQELAERLNGELKAAHEAGLRISLQAQDLAVLYVGSGFLAPQVRIRIWRESVLLSIPNYEKRS